MTVTSRVKEFENTPSALLTLDQFNTVELESEADPPVFTRNKIREVRSVIRSSMLRVPGMSPSHLLLVFHLRLQARAKAIQENNVELLTSGLLDDPREGKRSKKWRRPSEKQNFKRAKFKELYQSLEKELGSGSNKETISSVPAPEEPTQDEASGQIVLRSEGELSVPTEQLATMYPKSKYGQALLLPSQATAEELQQSAQPTEEKMNLPAWKEEMPESHMEEIESLFRSEDEVAQKEAIFNKMNKDYLVQQERKETERLTAEAASKDQEKDDAAQVEGHARYAIKSGRSRKRRRDSTNSEGEIEEPTTEEALYAAVSTRKISRKINYDAMSAIFDEDGTFSTDILDPSKDPSEFEEVDPVLEMV